MIFFSLFSSRSFGVDEKKIVLIGVTYYRNIFGQDVNLSVIRIITDEGIEGNSFLGSSKLGSEHHHKGIVDFAKEKFYF